MNLEILENQNIFKQGNYRSCNFSYKMVEFYDFQKEEKYNVLVMKDLFTGIELSLTNCIEEAANMAIRDISKEHSLPLGIRFILYSDTENQWDIFDLSQNRFHYLGIISDILKHEIYDRAKTYINKIR